MLFVLVAFTFGLAALFSVAFVRFRDIEPIWAVVLQIMFYASGVFFSFDAVLSQKNGQVLVDVLMCNPFAAIMATARHVLVDPTWQAPWQSMSSPWLMVIPVGIMVLAILAGLLLFRAQAPLVAEEL